MKINRPLGVHGVKAHSQAVPVWCPVPLQVLLLKPSLLGQHITSGCWQRIELAVVMAAPLLWMLPQMKKVISSRVKMRLHGVMAFGFILIFKTITCTKRNVNLSVFGGLIYRNILVLKREHSNSYAWNDFRRLKTVSLLFLAPIAWWINTTMIFHLLLRQLCHINSQSSLNNLSYSPSQYVTIATRQPLKTPVIFFFMYESLCTPCSVNIMPLSISEPSACSCECERT